MDLSKRKILNFRFFVCLCLTVCICIALAVCVFTSLISKIILISVLGAGFILTLILAIIFKKKFLCVVSAILIFTIFPVLNLIIRQNNINKNLVFDSGEVLVAGRICENYTYTEKGNVKLVIDELSLTNADYHREPDGKFVLYINPNNIEIYNFKVGCFVEVLTDVDVYEISNDDIYRISNGIIGSAFCRGYEVNLYEAEDLGVREKIRFGVYEKLKNWNVDYAEVGYAMMFGDTTALNLDTLEMFRSTGIAHLLAVSGLHVSLIAMLISFILKKFKLSPYLNFAVVSVLLMFYCFLCEFSVSVVRASLMTMILLFLKARGKPYDRLSILSLVALMILLVNPLKLFNVSFVLSFSAVLSIILTVPPLKRLFDKIFYSKVSSALSLCVGVQIGLFAVQLFYFGTYPVLSIFANLISVPLESFAFVYLICTGLISLVLPFMSFLPRLFGIITSVTMKLNGFIAGLGLVINYKVTSIISIALIFIALFLLSDYIFAKKKWKALSSAGVILCVGLVWLIHIL